VVFECTAPDGQDPDEVFGPYLDHPGEECFFANQTSVMHSCYRVLFVWATGGKVSYAVFKMPALRMARVNWKGDFPKSTSFGIR